MLPGDQLIVDRAWEEKNPNIFFDYYAKNDDGGFRVFPNSNRHAAYLKIWEAKGKKGFAVEDGGIAYEVEPLMEDGKLLFFEKRGFLLLPWTLDFWRAPQPERVVIGLAGTGKAQPMTSKVLTPHGWSTMGEIEIGDWVMGDDGCPHRVLGTYPQGQRPVYKLTFADGAEVEADSDHLWGASWKGHYEFKTRTTLEVKEIVDSGRDLYTPPLRPVDFAPRDVPLDPYLIGVLIGDGSLCINGVRVSSADDFIVQEVIRTLPEGFKVTHVGQYDYAITDVARTPSIDKKTYRHTKRTRQSRLNTALRDLGLFGVNSHQKFIPDCYKVNSLKTRVALLQGLLDTDGSVAGAHGSGVEFCTVSHQLAEDVKELVLSLGGKATVSDKKTSWTYKGIKKYSTAFRVYIKLPSQIVPFRLPRKLEAFTPASKYEDFPRKIVSVEYVREDETKCILVDSHSHLYVTDGYVVTHNTMGMGALAMFMCASIPNFRFLNVAPTIYQSNLMVRTIHDVVATARFNKTFLEPGAKGFRQKPYATFTFKNGSTAEFMSVDKNARNIQSWYGDWINIDESGLLNEADESGQEMLATIMIGLATRLRGTRPDGQPRLGWLSQISMAYDCDTMWDLFDLGQTNTKTYYARQVYHKDNPYLTPEDLARFRRNAELAGQVEQWMEGKRPPKKGAEIPGMLIDQMMVADLDPEAYTEEGIAGLTTTYLESPQRDHVYLMAGDPGHGNPPLRNAPSILMFDVTDFPVAPARLAGFWWGFGNGSISPFINKFDEWMERFRIPETFRGYDSTSSQKAIAELSWSTGDKVVIPLGFEGAKKYQYINSAKILMSKNKLISPKLHGLEKQLRDYRLPDTKIPQDLASAFFMACHLMIPLYQDTYPEEQSADSYEAANRQFSQMAGRSYRPYGSRYSRR